MPSADDAERVRMSNMADGPVAMDIPQTMILNMNGADGDVECKIVAPSGREDDCFITPLGNGEHTVRFVPKEEGIHHLHAKLNGIHIPGSPFKLEVQANNNQQLSDDPSSVAVRGSGIDRGTTGKSSKFVIDTSGVGAGTLSITVDGPSKVDLSCNEVDDGYEVSYMPMCPGKYYVTVKYNGKNVRGSPFSVMVGGDNLVSSSTSTAATINNNNRSAINNNNSSLQKEQSRSSMTMETMQRTSYIRHQYSEQRVSSMSVSRNQSRNQLLSPPPPKSVPVPESDPAKVKVRGKGLEQALISRQNSFQVDCNRAGNNVLYVGVYGPDIPCDEVVIKHQGEKKYLVSYVVHEKGEYIIFVKWGDDHIPGSPYRVVA
jgi:filamin